MTADPETSGLPVGPDAARVELVLGLQLVLGRLIRQLRRTSAGQVGVSGMSALSSLAAAGSSGGLRSSDLATAENVSAPTMTRVVDHLVAQQLVRRTANPEDGRSNLVQLTSAGRAMLEAVRDDRGRYLLARVAALDPARLATLADALPVLAFLAEAVPAEAGPAEAGPGEAGPAGAGPGEAGPGETVPGERTS